MVRGTLWALAVLWEVTQENQSCSVLQYLSKTVSSTLSNDFMITIVDGTVQKHQNTRARNGSTQQPNFFYTDKHFLYLHFCFSKHCSKSNFKLILTHFKNSKVAHAHMGHLRGPIFLMQVHITSVYNFVVLHFALNPLQSIKNLCNLSLWCTVPLV